MKGKKVVHSSNSDEWETPLDLFEQLSAMNGGFDLDAAATKTNALCKKYFTKKDDALKQTWFGHVWCNPPYSQWQKFVQKAAEDLALKHCKSVVMLLPSRTDTLAFHKYIWNASNVDITFIKGRLKFSNSKCGAPFPSMIVHFYR